MLSILKNRQTVECPRKRWIIALGGHHNILIVFKRYPLDGVIDLSDLTITDFQDLSKFLLYGKNGDRISICSDKWSFAFSNEGTFSIGFANSPFLGYLDLGEVSQESRTKLSGLFGAVK